MLCQCKERSTSGAATVVLLPEASHEHITAFNSNIALISNYTLVVNHLLKKYFKDLILPTLLQEKAKFSLLKLISHSFLVLRKGAGENLLLCSFQCQGNYSQPPNMHLPKKGIEIAVKIKEKCGQTVFLQASDLVLTF